MYKLLNPYSPAAGERFKIGERVFLVYMHIRIPLNVKILPHWIPQKSRALFGVTHEVILCLAIHRHCFTHWEWSALYTTCVAMVSF